MNLLDYIKVELKKISTKTVVHNMGYQSAEKGINIINAFLKTKTLYDWLSSGHYDYKYSAEQFFVKLTATLKIEPKVVKKELELFEKTAKEYKKFEDTYIFVNTNFKRESQPIFALAMMESFRLILPDKMKLIFKSDKQILSVISGFVASHYKENDGELKIWGKIDNYIYHHIVGKTYTFNRHGKMIKDAPDKFEEHAFMSL